MCVGGEGGKGVLRASQEVSRSNPVYALRYIPSPSKVEINYCLEIPVLREAIVIKTHDGMKRNKALFN